MDLTILGQKRVLLSIFSQIDVNTPTLEEMKNMLMTEFPFHMQTLESIYDLLYTCIQQGKIKYQKNIASHLESIQHAMQHEIANDVEDADALLSKI